MRILGIDPGTAITGWGVIQKKRNSVELIALSSIKTKKELEMPQRLHILSKELSQVIREYKPEVIVVEQLFFNSNAKTAMSVGQARGVVMMIAAKYRLKFVEYTALTAKLILSGYGRASKEDVRRAVGEHIDLPEWLKKGDDDIVDAIAIALCHVAKQQKKNGDVIKVPVRSANRKFPVRKKKQTIRKNRKKTKK